MKKLPLVLILLLTVLIVNAQKDYTSSFGVTRNFSTMQGEFAAFEGYNLHGNSVLLDYSQNINKHSEWVVKTGLIWKTLGSDYENPESSIGRNDMLKPIDNNSFLTVSGIYSYQPIKYLYIRGGINNMFRLTNSVTLLGSDISPVDESFTPNKPYILEGYAGAGVRIPVWRFLLKAGFFSEVALNHSYWNYGLEAGLYFQFKKRKNK